MEGGRDVEWQIPLTLDGAYLEAVAETYCAYAKSGIRWSYLPMVPETFAEHLLVERTAILFAMRWHDDDERAAAPLPGD